MASKDNTPGKDINDQDPPAHHAHDQRRKVSILGDPPTGYDNMAYDGKVRKISQVRTEWNLKDCWKRLKQQSFQKL